MPSRPTDVEGVPGEVLDQIREQVLEAEREKLDFKNPKGVRQRLKTIFEQEITEEFVEE